MAGLETLAAAEEGCYEAPRAAALAGVPLSTVYHWARTDLVVPSVSPTREMLWSYADLVTLRLVAWLRHSKRREDARTVRASPMREVRKALTVLAERRSDPWSVGDVRVTVRVDGRGTIFVEDGSGFVDLRGQPMLALPEHSLDLLRPFTSDDGPGGPDLVRPRPRLRIVPAKVAGEPHVEDTRITTRTLSALARRGIEPAVMSEWYAVPESAVADAVDLEDQLSPTRTAA